MIGREGVDVQKEDDGPVPCAVEYHRSNSPVVAKLGFDERHSDPRPMMQRVRQNRLQPAADLGPAVACDPRGNAPPLLVNRLAADRRDRRESSGDDDVC